MFRIGLLILLIGLFGCGEDMGLLDQMKQVESLTDKEPIVDEGYKCLIPEETRVYDGLGQVVTTWDKTCLEELYESVLSREDPKLPDNPDIPSEIPDSWTLIATLQPNPRDIDEFLIDDHHNEHTDIMDAYLEGKWFVFEIGTVENNRQLTRERFLLVQRGKPFQDLDDDQKKPSGEISAKEKYNFESQPTWYTNSGSKATYATGFVFEVHYQVSKHTQTGALHNLSDISIYLNKAGRNFIQEDVRMRVYVN